MTWTSEEVQPQVSQPQAAPADMRASPRYDTDIEGRVSLLGTDHRCVISNMSKGGMTVKVPAAAVMVCTGQQMIVDTEQMGSLYGIVRWFRNGSIGVQFQTPMELDLLNHARQSTPKAMQARVGRVCINIPAVARIGNTSCDVEVGNIAVGGLMMTAPEAMRPAQPVMIELRDMMPLVGQVRWAEAGQYGVMFTKLLPLPTASEIARRAFLGKDWLDGVRAAHAQASA